MNKVFLLAALFLINNCLLAQENAKQAVNKGVAAYNLGDFNSAITYYNQALALGENIDVLKAAYINKGLVQREVKLYDSALISFNKAYALDSADLATIIDIGRTYVMMKNVTKAVAAFELVIKKNSVGKNAIASHYNLGRVYYNEKKYALALANYDKIIIQVKNDAEYYYLRANCKFFMDDMEGALIDLDKAIELNPEYMEAYSNRGTVKINRMKLEKNAIKKNTCLEEPCKDWLKAKELGDTEIDDLIKQYCKKCN